MKKVCVFLVVVLMFSCTTPIVNAESSNSKVTSFYELEDMVQTYISQMKGSSNGQWGVTTKISSSKALFGNEEEVTGYLFNLSTQNSPSGYMILDSKSGQLIEYAYDGTCFLYEAIDETNEKVNKTSKQSYSKNSSKVYWLGNLNYVIGYKDKNNKNKRYYDVSSDKCCEVTEYEVDNYPKSSPSSQNSVITKPSSFESGYISASIYTIPQAASIKFFSMTDLGANACTPVAGTNWCLYFYTVHKGGLGKLFDVSWYKTYNNLKKYMKTSSSGSTTDTNALNGYVNYIRSRGYTAYGRMIKGTHDGIDIANQLYTYKNPVHMSIYNHPTYGNHSVLAVGYQKYAYNGVFGKQYSTYIQIADGWKSGTPTRYIWGNCVGTWTYFEIDFL